MMSFLITKFALFFFGLRQIYKKKKLFLTDILNKRERELKRERENEFKAVIARVYRSFSPAIDNWDGGREICKKRLQYVWAGFFT